MFLVAILGQCSLCTQEVLGGMFYEYHLNEIGLSHLYPYNFVPTCSIIY